MPRVSRTAIEDRLARMAREIDAIDSLRPNTFDQYLLPENETLRVALEHRIFVALQAMVDVAAHIAATTGYGVPATYREAVAQLGRTGVIPKPLAESLADAAGLRNAIAHAYLDLDPVRVFEGLQKTDELKRFAIAVWEWLEGQ